MNKVEYQDYETRVKAFGERSHVHVFSPLFPETDPHFSWVACDCCKRPLGGNRYDVTGLTNDLMIVDTYTICPDCYYYSEYGQLDDQTMLDIED